MAVPRRVKSLSRNRLHVFSDHLEITGLEVAKICADNEHVAGVAEREVRLVLETHTEIERAVFDGMGDKVHDLAMNLRISPSETVALLLDRLVEFPPLLRRNRGQRRVPVAHGLWFCLLRHA